MRELMRRRLSVPIYWMTLILITVALAPLVSIVVSTKIARQNAAEQLVQYRADQRRQAESNKAIYCALFGSQADAFAEAESPAGLASRKAWLDLYELARCEPPR